MPDVIRIGEGAGGTDAWIPPARDLALRGELDYLTFECLAERTIAFAQTERLRNPDAGFDRLVVRRLEAALGVAAGDRPEPSEVCLRVAARCDSRELAHEIGYEVKGLWLAGPAGGGGATELVREVIAIGSTYIPREAAPWQVEVLTWPGR